MTEGSLAPIACLEDEVNQCERASDCTTLFVLEKLYQAICDVVDHITLEDIVNHADSQSSSYLL